MEAVLEAAKEAARKRAAILRKMRVATQANDLPEVIQCARELFGIAVGSANSGQEYSQN
jgi:hypothetical protein